MYISQESARMLYDAAQDFIKKCDSGLAKSIKSYTLFKEAVQAANTDDIDRTEGDAAGVFDKD